MKIFKYVAVVFLALHLQSKVSSHLNQKHIKQKALSANSEAKRLPAEYSTRIDRAKKASRHFLGESRRLHSITGTKHGIDSAIVGALITQLDRAKQKKIIQKLKGKLASQSTLVMMKHNQYNQVLGAVHDQVTDLSGIVDTLRLDIREKILEYEQYVKNHFFSLEDPSNSRRRKF